MELVSVGDHPDVVAVNLVISFINGGLAIIFHVDDDGVVFEHFARSADFDFAVDVDFIAYRKHQGVAFEILENDFVAVARCVSYNDFATHDVHDDHHAVGISVQGGDFHLADIVRQCHFKIDGLRGVAFVHDLVQGDVARGLDGIFAAEQVHAAFMARCQSDEANQCDDNAVFFHFILCLIVDTISWSVQKYGICIERGNDSLKYYLKVIKWALKSRFFILSEA